MEPTHLVIVCYQGLHSRVEEDMISNDETTLPLTAESELFLLQSCQLMEQTSKWRSICTLSECL